LKLTAFPCDKQACAKLVEHASHAGCFMDKFLITYNLTQGVIAPYVTPASTGKKGWRQENTKSVAFRIELGHEQAGSLYS
jgi:hypothetical protein